MDDNNLTEEQETIKKDLEAKETNTGEGHNPRLEYMTNRIENIITNFNENEEIIEKNSNLKLPKPSFNILNYKDREIIKFLMPYIEEFEINRKTKYNINNKKNIETGNITPIKIIDKILKGEKKEGEEKNYKTFAEIDTIYFYTNYNYLESMLMPNKQHRFEIEILSYYNPYNEKSILRKLLKKSQKSNFKNISNGLFAATMFNFYLMSYLEGRNIYINFQEYNILNPVLKYRILWNLFIKVINLNFQDLLYKEKITEKKLSLIINKLNFLSSEIENYSEEKDYEDLLINGYYKYNYILKIRTFLFKELDYLYKIKRFEKNYQETEETKDFDNTKADKINMLFNDGVEIPDQKTFNKNIKHCKEFIYKYNTLAKRNLSLNSMNTLKAVYRTLFIYQFKFNRLTPYTMSKKIIELYDKTYLTQQNDTYIPEDESSETEFFKKKPHEINHNFFENSYILGSLISNTLMEESPNGKEKLCQKHEFLYAFYKLALLMLYNNCPCIGDESTISRNTPEIYQDIYHINDPTIEIYESDLLSALENIKHYFEEIMNVLYTIN